MLFISKKYDFDPFLLFRKLLLVINLFHPLFYHDNIIER